MTRPTFDATGYPTEATLRIIRRWDIRTKADCEALLEFVGQAWSDYGAFRRMPRRRRRDDVGAPKRRWILVTGGWSGNESLIGALEANRLFMVLVWWSSARGGLHEFRT